MRIALDKDGVLSDTISSLVYTYKQHFPNAIVKEPFTKWDIAENFDIGTDIYAWGFKDKANEVFFENATAYPDTLKGLDMLIESGHELTVITYQNEYTAMPTMKWLSQGLLKYFKEVRIMINDTSKPGNGKEYTDYDLYLDDCGTNIQSYLKQNRAVVCMNRPWNTNVNLDCPRVNNMEEFYEYVLLYEKRKNEPVFIMNCTETECK